MRRTSLLELFAVRDSDRIPSELTRDETLQSHCRKRSYNKKDLSKVNTRSAKTKKISRTNRVHIRLARASTCCNQFCLKDKEKLPYGVVQDTRKWFHTFGNLSRTEGDKNMLLKEIIQSEALSESTSYTKHLYSIPNTSVLNVCAIAMKKVLGTSNNKWNKVKNGTCDYLDESVSSRLSSKPSLKEELIYRFLKTLRDENAEYLPNEDAFDLPSNMLLSEIIRMFQVGDETRHLNVSKVYFMRIWEVDIIYINFEFA